eukprot:619371-Amphidinium_carterae.2
MTRRLAADLKLGQEGYILQDVPHWYKVKGDGCDRPDRKRTHPEGLHCQATQDFVVIRSRLHGRVQILSLTPR